ncbi:MAG: hypothetical protein U9M95_01855 [Candidatus Altiarchaeota archaeon]|nr:hypothetical protein [Candidatus Altiarchaeota archaeon]
MYYEEVRKSVTGSAGGDPREQYRREKRRNRMLRVSLLIGFVMVVLLVYFLLRPGDGGNDVNSGSNTSNDGFFRADNRTFLVHGSARGDYRNISFVDGLRKALGVHGVYFLETGLGVGECYSLGVSWDGETNYVNVKKLTAYNGGCASMSDLLDETKIKTESLVNIRCPSGRCCFCGSKRVELETFCVGYRGTNRSSLVLEVKVMEDV